MIKLKLTFESPVFKEPRRLIWEASELMIGRSSKSDFVVPLPTLSGKHIHFQRRDNHYVVADADSRNGTLLDEVRLESGQYVPVHTGMILRTIDLTVRVELTEHYDAESFTMQTATHAIRHMAQDALSHDGRDDDAYLEVMSGALRGRKFILDDRLRQGFIGSAQGALIRLHEGNMSERVALIERTELGFLIEPISSERVLIDGQVITGKYELSSRQRVVLGELELYFFDPVEDLMLVLDGVLPPVERHRNEDSISDEGEQGGETPEASLSMVKTQEPEPESTSNHEVEPEVISSSRLSPLEIMIMLMILLMVGAAVVILVVFVSS